MSLLFTVCLVFATVAEGNNVTAVDDNASSDSPFTVHHVDELDAFVRYHYQMDKCMDMSIGESNILAFAISNIHHLINKSNAEIHTAYFCDLSNRVLGCFNKTAEQISPGERGSRVDYEILKLLIRDYDDDEFPIDVDKCESLVPSMKENEVPVSEICTIRQLAELRTTESACYEEHIATAKLMFARQGGLRLKRPFLEKFSCEQVEDYMNKCLKGNLALCYKEDSGRYLRRMLFNGHHFKDRLSKTVTHAKYPKHFWYNCRRKGYFRTDAIHSLSYFVKHERPINNTNGTEAATRKQDDIDKVFDKISIALNTTDSTPKPSETEEEVPVPDRTFQGLDKSEAIAITSVAIFVVLLCIAVFILAFETITGRPLCSWCPTVKIPRYYGWCASKDVPYKAELNDIN